MATGCAEGFPLAGFEQRLTIGEEYAKMRA